MGFKPTTLPAATASSMAVQPREPQDAPADVASDVEDIPRPTPTARPRKKRRQTQGEAFLEVLQGLREDMKRSEEEKRELAKKMPNEKMEVLRSLAKNTGAGSSAAGAQDKH